MRTSAIKTAVLVIVLLACVGCGATSSSDTTSDAEDDTETATIPPTLASDIESSADVLVPLITSAASVSINTKQTLDYGTESRWNTYVNADNIFIFTDIFGDTTQPAPVTRIRVLMDGFVSTLTDILSSDPTLTCQGASLLNEGNTIEIAFFGEVANGEAGDRFYECYDTRSGETLLYGINSDHIIRIVVMQNISEANDEEVATRGNARRLKSVTQIAYRQKSEGGTLVGYIDLRYTQATIYSGVDNDVDAGDDNVIFKSRSHITGRITFDDEGNIDDGTGEFSITKYDRGVNKDLSVYTITTQTIGRGRFGEDQYAILKINTTQGDLGDGIFCIRSVRTGTAPTLVATTNCSAFESAFSWSGYSFPFSYWSALPEALNDREYYDPESTTDMIDNAGSNFSIPTYETTSAD